MLGVAVGSGEGVGVSVAVGGAVAVFFGTIDAVAVGGSAITVCVFVDNIAVCSTEVQLMIIVARNSSPIRVAGPFCCSLQRVIMSAIIPFVGIVYPLWYTYRRFH